MYTHLKLNMVTNGVLFRGIWEEAFLKHGDYLNISLNAIDPTLYGKIVQFGRQSDVISNIDRLVSQRNATSSSLKLRISAVILDDTVHEMADFVQWAADHGLDQALLFTDHFGTIRKHGPEQVQRFIAQAYEAADRNPQVKLLHLDDFDWYYARISGRSPVRPRASSTVKPQPCSVAFDTLFVNPDGAAKPCCKSWYLYGNLVESTIGEVWDSEAAFRFRKRMLRLDFRDCMVACDLNSNPINAKVAQLRKAYWLLKRDPNSAVKKAIRKFGLSSAQLDRPDPVPLMIRK
ncbi:SPASM domain-containing protein [candidate division KSB1 bacterium]|nr:SPASM domain-containing protein [candidate division KSB1 bacterium]